MSKSIKSNQENNNKKETENMDKNKSNLRGTLAVARSAQDSTSTWSPLLPGLTLEPGADTLVSRAYYYAGQAVAGLIFGWDPILVTIGPGKPAYEFIAGVDETTLAELEDSSVRPYVMDALARLASGAAALQQQFPNSNPTAFWKAHGMADRELMQDLALKCSRRVDVTADLLLGRAERRARQIVLTHWAQIQLLAQALLVKKALRRDEVIRGMCEPILVAGADKFNSQLAVLEEQCGMASFQTEDY